MPLMVRKAQWTSQALGEDFLQRSTQLVKILPILASGKGFIPGDSISVMNFPLYWYCLFGKCFSDVYYNIQPSKETGIK